MSGLRKRYACLDNLTVALAALRAGDLETAENGLSEVVTDPEFEMAMEDLDGLQSKQVEDELVEDQEVDEDEEKDEDSKDEDTKDTPEKEESAAEIPVKDDIAPAPVEQPAAEAAPAETADAEVAPAAEAQPAAEERQVLNVTEQPSPSIERMHARVRANLASL